MHLMRFTGNWPREEWSKNTVGSQKIEASNAIEATQCQFIQQSTETTTNIRTKTFAHA